MGRRQHVHARQRLIESERQPVSAADVLPEGLNPIARVDWLKVLIATGLGVTTKCVAHTLALHGNPDGTNVNPGVQLLATECSISQDTVKVGIGLLVEVGLLHRLSRGGGPKKTAARYQLTCPDDLRERLSSLPTVKRRRTANALTNPLSSDTDISGTHVLTNPLGSDPEAEVTQRVKDENSAVFDENSAVLDPELSGSTVLKLVTPERPEDQRDKPEAFDVGLSAHPRARSDQDEQRLIHRPPGLNLRAALPRRTAAPSTTAPECRHGNTTAWLDHRRTQPVCPECRRELNPVATITPIQQEVSQ